MIGAKSHNSKKRGKYELRKKGGKQRRKDTTSGAGVRG